ncbi:MAG: methyl-accepting chemotaxis protein [Planctomycetota bacterium]
MVTDTLDSTWDWVQQAVEVCREAAGGRLEARILRIKEDGPPGELLHSINHLLDMTDAFVREATAALEYASQGKFFRRVILSGMRDTFRQAAQSINTATMQMDEKTRSLREAENRCMQLAGEYQSTRHVVQGLEQASREIGDVAKVIGDIASQTNLLALNASIEAARVGEAGRGFAVVAAHVKILAARSSEATSGIEVLIKAIQSASKDAIAAIDRIWNMVPDASHKPPKAENSQ